MQRAAKLFDRVVVAVAKNEGKNPLFTLNERLALVKKSIAHLPNVEADSFDSLLVEYVVSRKAQAIVRGLRAISDFEFEFQLALMKTASLNENIETIFMMPKDTYTFLSSRIVKETPGWVAMWGRLCRNRCKPRCRENFPEEKIRPCR